MEFDNYLHILLPLHHHGSEMYSTGKNTNLVKLSEKNLLFFSIHRACYPLWPDDLTVTFLTKRRPPAEFSPLLLCHFEKWVHHDNYSARTSKSQEFVNIMGQGFSVFLVKKIRFLVHIVSVLIGQTKSMFNKNKFNQSLQLVRNPSLSCIQEYLTILAIDYTI